MLLPEKALVGRVVGVYPQSGKDAPHYGLIVNVEGRMIDVEFPYANTPYNVAFRWDGESYRNGSFRYTLTYDK